MTRSRLSPLLVLTLACTRPPASVSTAEPPSGVIVEPDPAAPTGPSTAGPLQILWRGQLREPSTFRPSSPNGMTDEPTLVGWSRRTGEFGVCTPSGGAVCERCELSLPHRPLTILEVGEDCSDEHRVTPLELERRLAEAQFRIDDGDWLYGAQVVLVVRSLEGPADPYGTARGVIEVGARLRDEQAGVGVLARIEHCLDDEWCAPEVHVDAIAPSPDGRTIALLAHTFAGEFTDTYPLLLLDAEDILAAANQAEEMAKER